MNGIRKCRPTMPLLSIALAASAGCASRPHALDYVVLASDGEEKPPSRTTLEVEAKAGVHDDYPLDQEPHTSTGTGGACGVGLIGEQCEHGLLEDETPLEEMMLLGPDGVVIEDWD